MRLVIPYGVHGRPVNAICTGGDRWCVYQSYRSVTINVFERLHLHLLIWHACLQFTPRITNTSLPMTTYIIASVGTPTLTPFQKKRGGSQDSQLCETIIHRSNIISSFSYIILVLCCFSHYLHAILSSS